MAVGGSTTGDHVVSGNVYCGGLFITSSASVIPAANLQRPRVVCVPITNHGSSPSAVRKTALRISGASATISKISASVTQAIASGTVTVDVYKNGSTVLGSTIDLNSSGGTGGTAGDVVVGSISSASAIQGDKLEVVVTVSTPSGGGGLDVQIELTETP